MKFVLSSRCYNSRLVVSAQAEATPRRFLHLSLYTLITFFLSYSDAYTASPLIYIAVIVVHIQPIPPDRPSITSFLVIELRPLATPSQQNRSHTPQQASNATRRLSNLLILPLACGGQCPIDCRGRDIIGVTSLRLWFPDVDKSRRG